VLSDEAWVYLEGVPLALWTCDAAMRTAPAHVKLGPVDAHGTRPQHAVLAGQWQAARPIQSHSAGDYTLVACMVGPGFDFADFSMVPPDSDEAASMRHHWPDLAGML
jgi:predicted cupin superfamily sugar epimerase